MNIRPTIRDYYRRSFKKIRQRSIHDISLWKLPDFTIEVREHRLNILEKWCQANKTTNTSNINKTNNSPLIDTEVLTSNLIKFRESKDIQKLFSLFNKQKYISHFLTDDHKNHDKRISLVTYGNLSKIFLAEYLNSENIQYLNSSLKINDLIFYCQITNQNSKYFGAVPSYFPCYYNNSKVDFFHNQSIAENIKNELLHLKSL